MIEKTLPPQTATGPDLLDQIRSLVGGVSGATGGIDEEAMYHRFKQRLIAEAPAVIALLQEKPAIKLTLDRPAIEADGKTLFGRIVGLIHRGWFGDAAKTNNAIRTELKRTGGDAHPSNISKEVAKLIKLGFLTNETEGYKATIDAKGRITTK